MLLMTYFMTCIIYVICDSMEKRKKKNTSPFSFCYGTFYLLNFLKFEENFISILIKVWYFKRNF